MEKSSHAEADSEKDRGGLAKVSLLIIRKQVIPDQFYGGWYSAVRSEGAIERTWTPITHNLKINPYKSSTEGSCSIIGQPVVLSHVRHESGFGDFMLVLPGKYSQIESAEFQRSCRHESG